RLPGALSVGVDEGVRQDAEEPRLEVRPRRELLAKAKSADIGLLHEIFGVRLRSGHPECRSVQRIDIGERLALERVIGHPVTLSQRRRHSRNSLYPRFREPPATPCDPASASSGVR